MKLKESNLSSKLSIWIGNLGKYNEGELIGEWVDLPVSQSELNEVFNRIGISDQPDDEGNYYEETFVADTECEVDLGFGEWTSIQEYNAAAIALEQIDDLVVLEALMDNGDDFWDAADKCVNGDISFYSGYGDDESLGRLFIDEFGEGISNDLAEQYFDYEELGRMLEADYVPQEEGDPETFAEYIGLDQGASNYEVGQEYVNMVGMDGISNKDWYFDYEGYGRDIAMNGDYIYYNGDLIMDLGGGYGGGSFKEDCMEEGTLNESLLLEYSYNKTGEKCPECGHDLVYRTGRFGQFIGCSNYPKCKFTKKIKSKPAPKPKAPEQTPEPKPVTKPESVLRPISNIDSSLSGKAEQLEKAGFEVLRASWGGPYEFTADDYTLKSDMNEGEGAKIIRKILGPLTEIYKTPDGLFTVTSYHA